MRKGALWLERFSLHPRLVIEHGEDHSTASRSCIPFPNKERLNLWVLAHNGDISNWKVLALINN